LYSECHPTHDCMHDNGRSKSYEHGNKKHLVFIHE